MNVFLTDPARRQAALRPPKGRKLRNVAFLAICVATAAASVVVLVFLIGAIVIQGMHHLNWTFLTSWPSPETDEAGIWPALGGTVFQLESARMELVIEGVLAVQAGANPRVVAQRLESLIPLSDRPSEAKAA